MLAETSVRTGSRCRSVPGSVCCWAVPAIDDLPWGATVLPRNRTEGVYIPHPGTHDGPRPGRTGAVGARTGPSRVLAASRREAQRGSGPPTEVGAVVREGDNQLAPGGTDHPARTPTTIPALSDGTPGEVMERPRCRVPPRACERWGATGSFTRTPGRPASAPCRR